MSEALERGRRNMEKFALLMLDLDGFKTVNDRWGHASGDRVLRIVSGRVQSQIRELDIAARLGGDEFGVIQLAEDQPSASNRLAERLSRALSGPISLCDTQTELSASIGISIYPDHGSDAETLLRRADAALYAVKNAGKAGCAMA